MVSEKDQKKHKRGFSISSVIIGSATTIISLMYYILNKERENLKTSLYEQKTGEAFDEIIQLAKSNSPEFWAHFQEKYPSFRKKLLEINPDLKASELILCAYIYLGFNTKDIAEYTFKAVQTIKNKKYNLRKRLSIPVKDNIMLWLRKNLDE
ncbi:DNA-binding NarL/FixJ family response regulator [Chryseobacterium defluvii]|uniref:DNA-binding NarL/FixJ family response regulator n=1 Tax=Chryseobacterium defluvii TaxID=160396 RepID=A0A840K8J9_9FLAO|nr:hypothetical protein [Chryseobacterium defluvii]MBB4805546.1 DNA-binding NarL/FixJ family response regulator [Chryseobacterium defluvii]